MSNLDSDEIKNTDDFGSVLAAARKAQNHTVDEISEHIKIPGHVIMALEENNLAALPAPTFAQGYLRAYARFLDIPEDSVLAAYRRAVPQDPSSKLKPRSTLPNEANSQSPLVKMITLVLLFACVAAAIYGSYQYYQKKADIMETELETKTRAFAGNSLDSLTPQRLNIKQNAELTETRLTEKGEISLNSGANDKEVDSKLGENSIAGKAANANVTGAGKVASATTSATNKATDVIKIIAREDAWLNVRDASSKRLFYNTLKGGNSKSFEGRAPFSISLGNAGTTRVLINDIEIDTKRYVRSNNTAKFIVSSKQGKVIFH